MRELKTDDIYAISAIIEKMNIKLPELTKIVNGKELQKNQSEIGNEIITSIITRIHYAKDDVNALLASIYEISVDEIKAKKAIEMIKMIKDLINNDDIKLFFK